jgi:hypothetical protein
MGSERREYFAFFHTLFLLKDTEPETRFFWDLLATIFLFGIQISRQFLIEDPPLPDYTVVNTALPAFDSRFRILFDTMLAADLLAVAKSFFICHHT